jgi:hypothetical protein
VLPEEAGIGAAPPVRASFESVANRSAPAISPISLAAVSGPHPRSFSLRGVAFDERGQLCLELADASGARGDQAHELARDPHARGLLCASEPAGGVPEPLGGVERPGRDLQLGPEIVQVPAQPLLIAGARVDQVLAMVDEQADIERRAVQVRAGEVLEPFP